MSVPQGFPYVNGVPEISHPPPPRWAGHPAQMTGGCSDSLKVLVLCGSRARRMRLMALWQSPERLAVERVLQRVASMRVVYSVSLITRSTSAFGFFRGAPVSGNSRDPPRRLSRNRRHHLPPLRPVSPIRALTVVSESTCTRASNSRARCSRAFQVFRRTAHRCYASRSGGLSAGIGKGLPRGTSTYSYGFRLTFPLTCRISHSGR